jgi:hypothetical protein
MDQKQRRFLRKRAKKPYVFKPSSKPTFGLPGGPFRLGSPYGDFLEGQFDVSPKDGREFLFALRKKIQENRS